MAHRMVSPVLIGRTREMDRIREALRLAASGEGRMMLLSGEAGIGKSRLIEEVEQTLEQNWTILRGNCYEQEVSFPYSPWVDMLRRFFADRTPSSEIFGDLAAVYTASLAQLLPEWQPQVLPEDRSALREPENEKRLLQHAILAWITQRARLQPVLLVIEDIHWGDAASLELLRFIVRHTADVPVMILATYRSDEVRPGLASFLAEMERERRVAEVHFAPLVPQEIEQMITTLLGFPLGRQLRLFEPVFAWMEGNPFYIEEILETLVNSGSLAKPPEAWVQKDFETLQIPRGIQAMVRRRAEGLSEAARNLLTLAAVAGQQFEGWLLEALVPFDDDLFIRCIRELIDAQFIVESTVDTYAFRHALTREAIYSALLGREKRNLHFRIGKVWETADLAAPNRHLAELAYHFYEAASWPEALDYAKQAGERAQALYAPREAALHFSRALDAARQLNQPIPISCLTGRANAYELLGDFDRALADYETALALAQGSTGLEARDPALRCRLLLQLGFLWHARDFRRSGDYFQQALACARQQPDPAVLGHALNRVGNWHMNQNHPFEAREYHEQALAIFERLDDAPGMGETLDLLGITHYLCGNMLRGKECFKQAVQHWQQLNARQNLIQSLVRISFPAVVDTEIEQPLDPAAQREYGETALSIAREMGWRSAEADAYGTLANLSNVGEYDRSLEDAQAGLAVALEIGHHFSLALIYSHFGEYYLDLYHLLEAREALEQSLQVARKGGSELLVYRSTGLLATVHTRAGRLADAEALLNEAIPAWQPHPSVFVRQAWRAKAELLLAQGRPAEALQIVDQLIESAENGPARGDRAVPALAKLRGEALSALRRWPEAEVELSTAVELAQAHRRFPLLWRAQISLGKNYLAHEQPGRAAQQFESAKALIAQLASRVPPHLREHFRERALAEIPSIDPPDHSGKKKARPGGLTERELEVAGLIARGKTNREIAEELYVGVRTVEAHVTRILSRLNFTSRTEVAVWAAANGLVNGSDDPDSRQ